MPRMKQRRRSRSRSVDVAAVSQGVAQVMANPGFNVPSVPDFIEAYVHREAAKALLTALENIPPIYVYGHVVRIVVEPA